MRLPNRSQIPRSKAAAKMLQRIANMNRCSCGNKKRSHWTALRKRQVVKGTSGETMLGAASVAETDEKKIFVEE